MALLSTTPAGALLGNADVPAQTVAELLEPVDGFRPLANSWNWVRSEGDNQLVTALKFGNAFSVRNKGGSPARRLSDFHLENCVASENEGLRGTHVRTNWGDENCLERGLDRDAACRERIGSGTARRCNDKPVCLDGSDVMSVNVKDQNR